MRAGDSRHPASNSFMNCRGSAVALWCLIWLAPWLHATTYFVDAGQGDDRSEGTSAEHPWRTLERANRALLQAGDQLRFAAGQRYAGELRLVSAAGTAKAPIVLGSYQPAGDGKAPVPVIDGHGMAEALLLRDCEHVRVEDLSFTADGGTPCGDMRCGILIENDTDRELSDFTLRRVHVAHVSYDEPGFVRPAGDVRTANGVGQYGWGIYWKIRHGRGSFRQIRMQDCSVERVDHTGIKLDGPKGGIRDVLAEDIRVSRTGGPGVQMSGVAGGRFDRVRVDHSGSTDDTRNWGRGSGLWTWGSRDVVIEHGSFTHANGPGDSAGVHIDFGCRNVIVQYNFSAHNAGGFCEILGDNHNCAYRYNVSVDDGFRQKGRQGAFQEGKTFWLSGYVGNRRKPVGPIDTYFYNNTIYVSAGIVAKFSIAPTASGVLVANNIFCLCGPSAVVAGDQLRAERSIAAAVGRAVMSHNLFLRAASWPKGLGMEDGAPVYGDPAFASAGGENLSDYAPRRRELVKGRGMPLSPIPGDHIGLTGGLAVGQDILGQTVPAIPGIGAIEIP